MRWWAIVVVRDAKWKTEGRKRKKKTHATSVKLRKRKPSKYKFATTTDTIRANLPPNINSHNNQTKIMIMKKR